MEGSPFKKKNMHILSSCMRKVFLERKNMHILSLKHTTSLASLIQLLSMAIPPPWPAPKPQLRKMLIHAHRSLKHILLIITRSNPIVDWSWTTCHRMCSRHGEHCGKHSSHRSRWLWVEQGRWHWGWWWCASLGAPAPALRLCTSRTGSTGRWGHCSTGSSPPRLAPAQRWVCLARCMCMMSVACSIQTARVFALQFN